MKNNSTTGLLYSEYQDSSIQIILNELIEISNTTDLSPIPSEISDLPFGEAFWQWLKLAHIHLNKKTTKRQRNLFSKKAFLNLEISLVKRWVDCCAPSLTLEMGIARLHGHLIGNSSKARYQSFIQQKIRSPNELRKFFQEYALIGRFVALSLQYWVNNTTELLKRLQFDSPVLEEFFLKKNRKLGFVTEFYGQQGDTHNRGQTVCALSFSSGLSLFYKPKNLSITTHFNKFIEDLNQLGLDPPLKSYQVLNRGNYCWEEKVNHISCKSREEVERFYQRSGMILCLLYILNGYDVHYENLIASGEYPIVIDLETLFHPLLDDYYSQYGSIPNVLRTGMLPQYVFGEPEKPAIDCSALLGEVNANQRERGIWENINTDEMHLVFIQQRSNEDEKLENKHRVFLNQELIFPFPYSMQIILGFETLYQLIKKNYELILRENSSILKMTQCPIRLVIRSTAFYRRILDKLWEPQIALNPQEIEKTINLLLRYPLHIKDDINLKIFSKERDALLKGDIPCFHGYPMKEYLFYEDDLISQAALKEIPYKSVKSLIENLHDLEYEKQVNYIKQSLYAAHFNSFEKSEAPITSLPNTTEIFPLNTVELLSKIEQIASNIRACAFENTNGSIGWIALDLLPNLQQMSLEPLSNNLYNGSTGIALFFASLFHITKKEKWKTEALNSLIELRYFLKTHSDSKRQLIASNGIGGMIGIGGIIYGIFHIGRLLQESELIDLSFNLVESIGDSHVQEDVSFDVMKGSAGLLLALLSLYHHSGHQKALFLAKLCGDHLCAKAEFFSPNQIAWRTVHQTALTGFSHGTAGIAYALMKLAHSVHNENYLDYALKALRFERSAFSKENKNWQKEAFCSHLPNYQTIQWCHGASGIGLGRLASLTFYQESTMYEEIDIAIETTIDRLVGVNHDLCCGTFGRLAFLYKTSEILKERVDLTPLIWNTLTTILKQSEKEDGKIEFHTGHQNYYNPSFMKGSAGIGYFLLRLLNLTPQLPDVLILE